MWARVARQQKHNAMLKNAPSPFLLLPNFYMNKYTLERSVVNYFCRHGRKARLFRLVNTVIKCSQTTPRFYLVATAA